MNQQEAKADAAKHYDMSEWLKGCKDAGAGISHVCGGVSYNKGYAHSITEQEKLGAMHG